MAFFGKTYKLQKQENYEDFVESFGLPDDRKSFLLDYKPDQKFEIDGDGYKHIVYVNGEEKVINFKSGEEFESTLRTVPVKTLYKVDGNTITQVFTFANIVTTIVKEFSGDSVVETITNSKWDGSAKRYYSV